MSNPQKTIVVTGSLENFSRQQIEQTIKDNGGKVSSSVSKNTRPVATLTSMVGPSPLAVTTVLAATKAVSSMTEKL